MKIHNIAIAGFIIGIAFLSGNFFRYYILYPDTSELVRGCLEGVFICAFAYVYNWMKNKDTEDEVRDNKFDGINKLILKEELQ